MDRVAVDAQKRDPDGMAFHLSQHAILQRDQLAVLVTFAVLACSVILALAFGRVVGAVAFAALLVLGLVLVYGLRLLRIRRTREAQLRDLRQTTRT